ncbi:hypothetical protein Egran_02025 [Elaphomyces granulatus]|uniref:HMG box domain-containing protein n=1 Tax=Elaphomyces granulatus TaxID=519963 RepID=A0A232M1C4_9EURO|nr:hypothetical protein Egran_02025 [Elaphomyces granulatus]
MAIERKISGAPPSPPHTVYRRPTLQPREITQQEDYIHGQFSQGIGHSELDTHDAAYNHCREPQFKGFLSSPRPRASEGSFVPVSPGQTSALSHALATSSEEGIITRSGRAIPPPNSPLVARNVLDKVRVMRMPRVRRRNKPAKADKGMIPTITAPLSELTKNMPHIPLKDMQAWVTRSTDVRLNEVAQKNGKIARPMNSFMLYRSAYAERTKQWCAQNNHQIVSRVSGQSWPLEPPVVRERYEYLSILERDNHQKAHPEYKFAPNKNQGTPKRKRATDDDDMTDLHGQEHTLDSSPPSHRQKRARSSGFDSSYQSRDSTPFDGTEPALMGYYHWTPRNAGQQMPGMMPEQGQYFQPSIHPGIMGPHVEDVHFRDIGANGIPCHPTTTLAALPGSLHHDLLQTYAETTKSNQIDESQVDPQLLAVDYGGADLEDVLGHYQYSLYQAENPPPASDYIPAPNSNPHSLNLTYYPMMSLDEDPSFWNLGQDEITIEAGKDFDQWFDVQQSTS